MHLFISWSCTFSQQISKQIAEGIVLEDVQIKLQLSTLKPLHAGWLIDLYNETTSHKGVEIIKSGWRAAGIADDISLGLRNLPSIDPFDYIDPMLELGVDIGDRNIELITAVANLTTDELVLAASKESMSSDDDSDREILLQVIATLLIFLTRKRYNFVRKNKSSTYIFVVVPYFLILPWNSFEKAINDFC